MCTTNILCHNKFGCVAKSNGCGRIQIGFGNVFLVFSEEEFSDFFCHVRKIFRKYYSEMEESGNKLFLGTKQHNLMISLNPSELEQLNNLLTEASLMNEVDQIINPGGK